MTIALWVTVVLVQIGIWSVGSIVAGELTFPWWLSSVGSGAVFVGGLWWITGLGSRNTTGT